MSLAHDYARHWAAKQTRYELARLQRLNRLLEKINRELQDEL